MLRQVPVWLLFWILWKVVWKFNSDHLHCVHCDFAMNIKLTKLTYTTKVNFTQNWFDFCAQGHCSSDRTPQFPNPVVSQPRQRDGRNRKGGKECRAVTQCDRWAVKGRVYLVSFVFVKEEMIVAYLFCTYRASFSWSPLMMLRSTSCWGVTALQRVPSSCVTAFHSLPIVSLQQG